MTIQSLTERTTDGIAIASVTSPVWLPGLQHISETAALVVPILGAIWLVVQILGYTIDRRKNR